MKIKYYEKKLFNIYNESFSISTKKKKIEKNNILEKTNNFLVRTIIYLIIFISMFIFMNILFLKNNHDVIAFEIIWNTLTITYIILLAYILVIFVIGYYDFKKQGLNGILTITEEKIIDESDNIKLEFPLCNLTSLVIGQYCIVIFTNTKLYYRLPISCEKDILNALKKYKEDIKIIDNNSSSK